MSLDWRKRHWVRKTIETGVGGSSLLSFITGDSTYQSPYQEITFSPAAPSTSYSVILTSTGNTGGQLGEVWYQIISPSVFRVFRSGSTTASFHWAVVPAASGSKVNFGTANFAGAPGTLITLGFQMPSSVYSVFITPNGNPSGQLGEVWCQIISPNQFRVFNSGLATSSFSWTVAK